MKSARTWKKASGCKPQRQRRWQLALILPQPTGVMPGQWAPPESAQKVDADESGLARRLPAVGGHGGIVLFGEQR